MYFQQLVDTNRGLLQIREFIGSLIVVYSPIDHARVMSMKLKSVIIFLGYKKQLKS